MADPVLLFGVGATKAGTSWLYRMLDDHPECRLPAVKELHYWDSFAPRQTRQRVMVCRRQVAELEAARAEAERAGDAGKARNLTRRIDDTKALAEMLERDRTGDRAYLAYVMGRGGTARLVGDITPAYGALPEETLSRMARLGPWTRFVYLMRDPLARLWSHVRMLAGRQTPKGGDFAAAANRLLAAVLRDGAEPAALARGDYAGAMARLARAVPGDRLMPMFSEEALTQRGFDRLCGWLCIGRRTVPENRRVHAGRAAEIDYGLVPEALARLRPQYDWAARAMGPLPGAWQASMARMAA